MQTVKRVLLVEDDPDDRELFVDALKLSHPSIECNTAPNGLAALQHLSLYPDYDMIFLDLNMPIMNGFECLNLVKSNTQLKHIPVVILTTSNNMFDKQKCKSLGAETFFTKPPSLNELVERINNVLNK